VPALLELQRATRPSLVDHDDGPAAAMLDENLPADRLNIYRNTFVTGVTKALRLSYPAINRLVGNDFFEGAASFFIVQHPPRVAYLDEYRCGLSAILARLSASSVARISGRCRASRMGGQSRHSCDGYRATRLGPA
jgi:hypothetical protein